MGSRGAAGRVDVDDSSVVRWWTGLDRGWQALILGLVIVGSNLLIHPL